MKKYKTILIGAGILGVAIAVVLFRNQPSVVKVKITPPENMFPADTVPSKNNVSQTFIDHVEKLKKSIQENPTNVSHLKSLAYLLMDSHQNGEAIVYLEKAVALQPKNDSLLLDLAVCYFSESKVDKALSVTEKILSFQPNHPRALFNKGIIFASQNKTEEAEKVWAQLQKVAPNSSEAKQAKAHSEAFRQKQ